MRALFPVSLLVVLLSGCLGGNGGDGGGGDDTPPTGTPSPPTPGTPPTTPAPPPVTLTEEEIFREAIQATSAQGLSFQANIPDGAANVTIEVVYEQAAYQGLLVDLEGCGTFEAGQSGAVVTSGGSAVSEIVCGSPEPGPQALSLTLEAGVLTGELVIRAMVPESA